MAKRVIYDRMSEMNIRRLTNPTAIRNIGMVVVALVVAFVVSRAALRQPSLPNFEPAGSRLALPASGALQSVSLSEFEGVLVGQTPRPVVVNVWASWCAPCRSEMPLLQRASARYAGRIVMLGVASNDDRSAAQAFLTEFGITYPNVFDDSGEIRVRLELTSFPTTYVFGANGRLRSRVNGAISEQRLAALIEDALR